ncbi:MAG TPA: DNA translocase FtsK [Chloroflexia bacterium]|nr:DNA translocase FtsK [Chloroflexia bacterium]
MNISQVIADALKNYLATQLQNGTDINTRRFFRLDGFEEDVYKYLLDKLEAENCQLAGVPLVICTTGTVQGFEKFKLEIDKSATWHRNHVPVGHALVLIFNRRTNDSQSLKDIFPIKENLLGAEALEHLIRAAFTRYQLDDTQFRELENFLKLFKKAISKPQLQDLTEFLIATDSELGEGNKSTLLEAISYSLPYLGLFRSHRLADEFGSAKAEALLKEIFRGVKLGSEILDEKTLKELLGKLDQAEFEDDSSYGGNTPAQKKLLVQGFLEQMNLDNQHLREVLKLDWSEVSEVLYKKSRKAKSEQFQNLAKEITDVLTSNQIKIDETSAEVQEILQDLQEGQAPQDKSLEIVLPEYNDLFGKVLSNKLHRLIKSKKVSCTDFIVGLTSLAIDLLSPIQSDLKEGTYLKVAPNLPSLDFENLKADKQRRVLEAIDAFKVLYGSIEGVMPSVLWDFESLLALSTDNDDNQEGDTELEERKVLKTDLPFRVIVGDSDGQEIVGAELIWQYRSDSPAASTLANLLAEGKRLVTQADKLPLLSIPVYNNCPTSAEISDLDLRRPRNSLGAWYDSPSDLRQMLTEQLKNRAKSTSWQIIDDTLRMLEQAWGTYVEQAGKGGVLNSRLVDLVKNYQQFLISFAVNLKTSNEASYGYRQLTQAWIIGNKSFDEWAVIPFLHPLKLLWWHNRAKHFNQFIASLLDSAVKTQIADTSRFRQELNSAFNSAGFPAILALSRKESWPELFIPVDEAEGYELYRYSEVAGLAYGLDPDLVSDTDGEAEAQTAASALVKVIEDYIETYPFVRQGLEVYLVQCHNGALPGLLVGQLEKILIHHKWQIRLSVVVHTDRGAPIFRRVTDWLKANERFSERSNGSLFPSVTLKVLECEIEALFSQIEDTDIVILPDVLAERGQGIELELSDEDSENINLVEWLPVYQASQEPFERGENKREILLNPQPQPDLVRHFYDAQWAAKKRSPVNQKKIAQFRQIFSLQEWENELVQLHKLFNWVACYDITVDRFLLEATFPESVQVIRYSLGLGKKRAHSLTVSSSKQAKDVVIRRLANRLKELIPTAPDDYRGKIAELLVDKARNVSGDIVLRAAGPGAFLNELLGLVLAKYLTETRYKRDHPEALMAWIYLDDFHHWFNGKLPDLLLVAVEIDEDENLLIHLEILEAKCINQFSFEAEAEDAQRQVVQGVNRTNLAWSPRAEHLDAPYWYDQLYRAVVGNLPLDPDKREIWEFFRRKLFTGDFQFDLEGHSWVFCHDGSISLTSGQYFAEDNFRAKASDAEDRSLTYHHYGKTGLRSVLKELVEGAGEKYEAPPEIWQPEPEVVADHDVIAKETLLEEKKVENSPLSASENTESMEPATTTKTSSTPITLLGNTVPITVNDEQQLGLKDRARELERVLNQYNVRIYPIDYFVADVGPSIVRFKLRLRPGEQLNKVQRIDNDLARELALTNPPFINNVAGTNFVGIDLPRQDPETVQLLPLLENLAKPSLGELPIMIGKTPDGKEIIEDLSEFPHLLVAGATNSGKSVFLRSLVLYLIAQYSSEDLKFLIVDPKRTDFSFFDGLKYLIDGKVVVEKEEARDKLLELVQVEMPRRQQVMAKRSLRLKDFNKRFPTEALPPIVAIIDEYAQLLSIMNKNQRDAFERDLMSLAAVARSTGIHLIIATQRPSADVVTGTLKANLPTSIAFKVASGINSRIIIDQTGAENLLGRGDMLFRRASGELLRVQAPFIDEISIQEYLERHRSL